MDVLAKTFSKQQTEIIFARIRQLKPEVEVYLREILPVLWRSTAWIDDRSLPP